jgi:hypothetical protein
MHPPLAAVLLLSLAACSAAPRPPATSAVAVRAHAIAPVVRGREPLHYLAVVEDGDNGPGIARAVANALRRAGRRADLLPSWTVGADAVARSLGAEAVVHITTTVKRDDHVRTIERQRVVRPKTGLGTYLTPTTPAGIPEGVLDPAQELEETNVGAPVYEHLVDAMVLFRIVRLRDGHTLAAWRAELGADRFRRGPEMAPLRPSAGASQPSETRPRAWQAVRNDLGAAFLHRLEATEAASPALDPR